MIPKKFKRSGNVSTDMSPKLCSLQAPEGNDQLVHTDGPQYTLVWLEVSVFLKTKSLSYCSIL